MRRTSNSPLSRVLSTRSSCSTSRTSPASLSQDYEHFNVSSNNTKWKYEWTSTRRPVTNPVTGRRKSTGRPVTAWVAMRKGVTRKEFTLTSWKTEIAKCRRARTTRTQWKRRTSREAIPRAAKFGRIDNIKPVLIDTCESENNHRCAIVGQFGSLKIRDETKLLKADMESFPGIWHKSVKLTMELLKKKSRHLTVQKDLALLKSGMLNRSEVLCITVALDQSTVKMGNDENLPFKIKWDCWIAVRWMEEGIFARLLQLTTWR